MDMTPLFKDLGIMPLVYDDGRYWRVDEFGEGVYWPEPTRWAPAVRKLTTFRTRYPHPRSAQYREWETDATTRSAAVWAGLAQDIANGVPGAAAAMQAWETTPGNTIRVPKIPNGIQRNQTS